MRGFLLNSFKVNGVSATMGMYTAKNHSGPVTPATKLFDVCVPLIAVSILNSVPAAIRKIIVGFIRRLILLYNQLV